MSTDQRRNCITDPIDTLTGPELSEAIAREVMGYVPGNGMRIGGRRIDDWHPHENRNDLAEVMARLVGDVYVRFAQDVLSMVPKKTVEQANLWLLTCDPAIICRVVLRAVREAKR